MGKHAFLSFVVEDKDLVTLFRGQARNKNSDLEFDALSGLTSLTAGSIDTTQHPVVLAIMGEKWDGRALAKVLSFFSKVNLRRAIDDLERLRFPVRFRRVQIVAAP